MKRERSQHVGTDRTIVKCLRWASPWKTWCLGITALWSEALTVRKATHSLRIQWEHILAASETTTAPSNNHQVLWECLSINTVSTSATAISFWQWPWAAPCSPLQHYLTLAMLPQWCSKSMSDLAQQHIHCLHNVSALLLVLYRVHPHTLREHRQHTALQSTKLQSTNNWQAYIKE